MLYLQFQIDCLEQTNFLSIELVNSFSVDFLGAGKREIREIAKKIPGKFIDNCYDKSSAGKLNLMIC